MDPFSSDAIKRESAQQLVRREMERVSHDTIMVYNPTDEDFRLEWDGFFHVIPNKNKNVGFGNGKREIERFLARKYILHMKDLIINRMAQEQGQAMLEKRKSEGKEPLLDKYFENREIWDKVPRTDDPKLTEKIYNDLWLGVVRRYGDDPEEDKAYGDGRVDTRSIEERLAERMDRPYIPSDEGEIVNTNANLNVKARALRDVSA